MPDPRSSATRRSWPVAPTLALAALIAGAGPCAAATYFVRQSVGDDANDGLSAATAWKHVGRLSAAMQAGDTAFVGPGLYREEIEVQHDGSPEQRITFIADTTGQHTGDPPGVVMLTGAEPVDESLFVAQGPPGVYGAPFPAFQPWGVVEMDGPQYRYLRVNITEEFLVEKMPPLDVVAKRPSSFYYDEANRTLVFHTSDDRPPAAHELEIIRRGDGVVARGRHHITVMGFTFRHMQDAGVNFFVGSGDGVVTGVTAWGCRQGVRVYGASAVLVYGNTFFRNENSGVYFAAKSMNGLAIANTSFENAKGLRWSSGSAGGMALDNAVFDNLERGISLENVTGAVLRGNRLVGNAVSQLQVIESAFTSESNCFAAGRGQLVADFTPFGPLDRYPTLAEYRAARAQDLHSREGSCGVLPPKPDVHRLHAATSAAPAARDEAGESWGARAWRWLERVRGR